MGFNLNLTRIAALSEHDLPVLLEKIAISKKEKALKKERKRLKNIIKKQKLDEGSLTPGQRAGQRTRRMGDPEEWRAERQGERQQKRLKKLLPKGQKAEKPADSPTSVHTKAEAKQEYRKARSKGRQKITKGQARDIARAKARHVKCKAGKHCGSKRQGIPPKAAKDCREDFIFARMPGGAGFVCRHMSAKQIAARARRKEHGGQGGKKSFRSLMGDIQHIEALRETGHPDKAAEFGNSLRGSIRRQLGNMLMAGGMSRKFLGQIKESSPDAIKAFKRQMSGRGKGKLGIDVLTDPKKLARAFLDFTKKFGQGATAPAPAAPAPALRGPGRFEGDEQDYMDWHQAMTGMEPERGMDTPDTADPDLITKAGQLQQQGYDKDEVAELRDAGYSMDDILAGTHKPGAVKAEPRRAASEKYNQFNPMYVTGDWSLVQRFAVERTNHHVNLKRIARLANA